jgi:hypothetical protein
MGLMEELQKLNPEAETPQPNLQQPSWIKDLIDKRYQPQTERLKRNPVGFNFEREPFDPSSYYKQLGTFRDISRLATDVTRQEAANRQQAELERQQAANQAAINNSMGGIDPRFTYDGGGVSRKYGLKGVSPNVSRAADYFGSRYGIKTIGGLGPGSVPGSDHPKGRALDFMTYSNKSKGNSLANDVIKNAARWNVKYVIWNRYIWHPGRGWKRYNGPSPHTDHVHVSFNK